jgi:hypothetical protein
VAASAAEIKEIHLCTVIALKKNIQKTQTTTTKNKQNKHTQTEQKQKVCASKALMQLH